MLGVDDNLGSIKVGAQADFVVLDALGNVQATIKRGHIVYQGAENA
jgi:N-acetylglucosamine-6-phosphate deacetylase